MKEPKKWLREIIDPVTAGFTRRAFLREPVVYRAPDGNPRAVATDGRVIVVLEGDVDGQECVAVEAADNEQLAAVLEGGQAVERGTTTVEALAAWCGPYEAPERGVCPGCPCGNCAGGADYYKLPASRTGRLGGLAIDRNRLAQPLRYLRGACRVLAGPDRLELRGDGWRLILMALEVTPGDEGPVFPEVP